MSSKSKILNQLVQMSRNLGEPEGDYVILGEGNTSAKVNQDTFFVKASGVSLCGITEEGFVEVYFQPVLEMLKYETLTDEEIRERLMQAKVDKSTPIKPSVETIFHAYLLTLEGVNFVGHTHPTVVNIFLCSQLGPQAIKGRLFPDEIVYCGPAPAYLDYVDPGLTLAKAIRETTLSYIQEYNELPKVILIGNHGLIALANTAREVESITAMWSKAAKVLLGTYLLGGPKYLSEENVSRIHTRPDEEYRRRILRELRISTKREG